MTSIDIFNASGLIIYQAPVTNSCERSCSLQQSNVVRLVFDASTITAFPAGSYIEYTEGQHTDRFYLKHDYTPVKKSVSKFHYDVQFCSIADALENTVFYRPVEVDDVTWKEVEFSLNGNLYTIAQIALEMLNDRMPFGVTFSLPSGASTDYGSTDLKAMRFDGMKVTEAFNYIADTFETEWWIENTSTVTEKILHFDKCEHGSYQELSDIYVKEDNEWKSSGLSTVEQGTNENAVTSTLYAFGSERNILKKSATLDGMNVSYNKRLRLPDKETESITINGQTYTIRSYNDESKVVISGPGIIDGESIQMFDNIYPKMTMTIPQDGVRIVTQSDGNQLFYVKADKLCSDFMDSESYDPSLYDSKINPGKQGLLLEGCTLMATFTSGLLNAMEFECAWYPSTLEIGLKPNSESDMQVPFGAFKPQDGDTFVLWNLAMPTSAVDDAKDELYAEVKKYIEESLTSIPETKCVTEPVYMAQHGLSITLGTKVKVTSSVFAGGCIYSRVISFSYSLTNPYKVTFSLSSSRTIGAIQGIKNAISDIVNENDYVRQTSRSISMRQWHDVEELMNMVEHIKTEMCVVGSDRGSFSLSSDIIYANGYLNISKGFLQHQVYVDGDNKGEWRMTNDYFQSFIDGAIVYNPDSIMLQVKDATPYYIYMRCSKESNEMSVLVSEYEREHTNSHYYLLVGILSSVFEGERVFNKASGLTITVGGVITTETIQDASKQLIIDFASNPPRIIARNGAEIIGSVNFTLPDGTATSAGGGNIAKNSYKYRKGCGFGGVADTDDDSTPLTDMTVELAPSKTYIITAMSDGYWFKVNGTSQFPNGDHVELYLMLEGGDSDFIGMNECHESHGSEYSSGIGTKRILSDGRLAWCFTTPATLTAGSYTVRFDINKEGREHYLWDFQCVANSNIVTEWRKCDDDPELGAQNLSAVSSFTRSSVGATNLIDALEAGRVYVLEIGNATVSGSGSAYFEIYGASQHGHLFRTDIVPSPTSQKVQFIVPDDGDTYVAWVVTPSGVSITATDVSVRMYGLYNITDESTEYLKQALQASTDITGGLVSSSVVQVRDANNNVKGGISGLSDNVAFWSGGTYAQALSGLVNILLRKDGTGKIGGLKIENGYIQVDFANNGGYARLSSDGIRVFDSNDDVRAKLVGTDITPNTFIETADTSYSFDDEDDCYIPDSTGFVSGDGRNEFKTVTGSSFTISKSVNVVTIDYAFALYLLADQVASGSSGGYISFGLYKGGSQVKIFKNASWSFNNGTLSIDDSVRDTLYVSGSVVLRDLAVGDYEMKIYFNIPYGSNTPNNRFRLRIHGIRTSGHDIQSSVEIVDPSTIIGRNGIVSFWSGSKYFGAYLDPADGVFKIKGRGGSVDIQQV